MIKPMFKYLTLRDDEMLCMVTDLPTPPSPQPSPMYTLIGNANLSATAAKNI